MGGMSAISPRTSVVLPEPLGPKRPSERPECSWRFSTRTTGRLPYPKTPWGTSMSIAAPAFGLDAGGLGGLDQLLDVVRKKMLIRIRLRHAKHVIGQCDHLRAHRIGDRLGLIV